MGDMDFNEKNFTKEKATHLWYNTLVDKDFWVVDYVDNIDILQSVLDVLFNFDPDNRIYLGDYLQSQNNVRLIIKCQVCSKDLSSYDPFMGHDKGKKHMKALKQFFTPDITNPNLSVPIIFKSQDSLANGFEPDSLEYILSHTNLPVLGTQFIYQEIYEEREVFYTCQLCNARRMGKGEAFKHVTNDKHIIKLLNVKYNLQVTMLEDVDAYVMDKISLLEGRISVPFLTYHYSDINRTYKIPPKNNPPVVHSEIKALDGTEINSLMGSTESFLAELSKLQGHFNTCDVFTIKLMEDKEAMNQPSHMIQLLAEKLYIYGNKDRAYLADAEKLYNKTKNLSLVMD